MKNPDNPFFPIKIFLLQNDIRLKELVWFSGLNSTKISQIMNGRCTPKALELRKIVRGLQKLGYHEWDMPKCLKPTFQILHSGQYADEA